MKTVTEKSSVIKKQARDLLAGNWLKTAAAGYLVFLICFIPVVFFLFSGDEDEFHALPILAGCLCFLIMTGPVIWGYTSYILKLQEQDGEKGFVLLNGFFHFGKSLGTFFVTMLKMMAQIFGALIVFGLTGYLFYGILRRFFPYYGGIDWVLILTFSAAYLFFFITVFYLEMRYAVTFFLGVTYPQAGVNWFSKTSTQMMQGNIKKYLFLQLSFFPWWLLLAAGLIGMSLGLALRPAVWMLIAEELVFFIPASFLYGYLLTADSVFFRKLNEMYHLEQEELSEQPEILLAEKLEKKGKKRIGLYVITSIFSFTAVAGAAFLFYDTSQAVINYEGDYEDYYEDYYEEVDPDDVRDSITISAGGVNVTLSNGNGWLLLDEEVTMYNYLGPEEYFAGADSCEMAYDPYDFVHLAVYDCPDGYGVSDLAEYVDEEYYYDMEPEKTGTVSLPIGNGYVEIIYDEIYYNTNLYFESDGLLYHIYAVADTPEEAEMYVDLLRNSLT